MGELGKKPELTSRQKEILNLLRKGLTNSEICFALNISANTVKVHLANIYRILEVTNRTEAVSTDMSSDMAMSAAQEEHDEITLSICQSSDVLNSPLAHTLFLAIIQALQGCNVFQIKICNEEDSDITSDYCFKLSTPQSEGQSLFMALYQKGSDALLWSNLQKIECVDEIKLLAEQISIQLFRNVIRTAYETYSSNPEASPQWWYTSCYTIAKMENRSKQEFEKCEAVQQALLAEGKHKDFIAGTLAAAYYVAATENWIKSGECVQKLSQIVGEAMRDNPSSVYSLYAIALYNTFLGNHKEAINYFEVIKFSTSPVHIVCRRMLSQMYSRIGQDDKAAKELEEYNRYIPSSMYQPFQFVAKAFIHFMQNEYEDCKKVSEQILMFHPEIPYARLLLIACKHREGNLTEQKKQIQMLFEYNPGFSIEDLNRFFDCFGPAQRGQISEYLTNIFD